MDFLQLFKNSAYSIPYSIFLSKRDVLLYYEIQLADYTVVHLEHAAHFTFDHDFIVMETTSDLNMRIGEESRSSSQMAILNSPPLTSLIYNHIIKLLNLINRPNYRSGPN